MEKQQLQSRDTLEGPSRAPHSPKEPCISSHFSLLCLAPIEAFLSIISASSNACISLPFFIIFGLVPSFALPSIFRTATDSGFNLLINF